MKVQYYRAVRHCILIENWYLKQWMKSHMARERGLMEWNFWSILSAVARQLIVSGKTKKTKTLNVVSFPGDFDLSWNF